MFIQFFFESKVRNLINAPLYTQAKNSENFIAFNSNRHSQSNAHALSLIDGELYLECSVFPSLVAVHLWQ